ncbi:MAG: histidine phosphatase family protein [Acidimicrobiia bacterium]
MTVFLIRHAKAGSRHDWVGPDDQRPLVNKGADQAREIARIFGTHPIVRVLSSPYVRCVQTVEPLAHALHLTIEPTAALAEGAPFEAVLDLIDDLEDDAVLCSHGDVIPEVMQALERRGLEVRGVPDYRKGATWAIERIEGVCVSAHAIAPPGKED